MNTTFPHTDKSWNVSLHGGHSSAFCDHAESALEDIAHAAIAAGCPLYGITEHAPRVEPHHLYDEERAMGWTVETLDQLFTEYAAAVDRLREQLADRIILLKGFEAEVIPEDRYADLMLGLRKRFNFQYMVGSVHWVAGHIIDYRRDHFDLAADACGGVEALAVRYYETVAEMVRRLRPEIIGHLDIVRRHAPSEESVSTPKVRAAAFKALDVIREHECILDVNTGGYRKGFGRPFPAAWLTEAARDRGIVFCFGDDSHRVSEVCLDIPEARRYLLTCGVDAITALQPEGARLTRRTISLT
ncbi:MAG TPA: histidinol-phosphatase [Candidatus Hydrogenedentes bacterium]|mgnify:CR=1 FL=1|nr:histidinol-phosphatase [Candidatus Hydrogenedentota bacterium]